MSWLLCSLCLAKTSAYTARFSLLRRVRESPVRQRARALEWGRNPSSPPYLCGQGRMKQEPTIPYTDLPFSEARLGNNEVSTLVPSLLRSQCWKLPVDEFPSVWKLCLSSAGLLKCAMAVCKGAFLLSGFAFLLAAQGRWDLSFMSPLPPL